MLAEQKDGSRAVEDVAYIDQKCDLGVFVAVSARKCQRSVARDLAPMRPNKSAMAMRGAPVVSYTGMQFAWQWRIGIDEFRIGSIVSRPVPDLLIEPVDFVQRVRFLGVKA